MPLFVVMEEMSSREVEGWIEYFSRRPAGWQEDQRTAMLLNAQGVKKKGHEIFDSLRVIKEDKSKTSSQNSAAQSFLRKFGSSFPQLKLED